MTLCARTKWLVYCAVPFCFLLYFSILTMHNKSARQKFTIKLDDEIFGIQPNISILDIKVSKTSIQETINLTQIDYIANDASVCNKSSLILLGAVISSPENENQRQTLRRTWIKQLSTLPESVVFFFVGRSAKSEVNDRVIAEASVNRDMVIVDFVESYRNLSIKVFLMLRWVRDNCQNAKFVLKVDDDMFINVFNILDFVHNNVQSNDGFHGRFAARWRAHRSKDSKWFVSKQEFSREVYPDFVTGPSYLFGTKYIGLLLDECAKLPYLYLEDVFITGVCAERSNITRKEHPGFINESMPGGKCKLLEIISIHEVSSGRMQFLWNKIQDHEIYKSCGIRIPKWLN